MDWSFTVWQLANWKQLAKMPPALKPADMGDANNGPPTQIDVYTGGRIRWADVVVPKGIEVIDQRSRSTRRIAGRWNGVGRRQSPT